MARTADGGGTVLWLQLLGVVALLTACDTPPDALSYRPVTSEKQLMNWILDPNADVIWSSAGTITTIDGIEDLAPTTQEGWDAVRNAAATIAEAGNLLKMPGHARDSEDWIEIAGGLTSVGVKLIEAADAQDADAIFEYGGQLYNVCVACHQLYMLPESS